MQGLLSEGVVPGVLREIYVARRSGLLHFARGTARYGVRFVNGTIVHAESNLPQARLGEIMVGQGLLSEADLRRAQEVVARTRRRLGEVLVELGVLNWDRLGDALALQVRELLLQVFSWTDGRYEFEPREEVRGHATLKLSTGEMILEAVRRVNGPAAVRHGLGDLNRTVILSTDPLLRFQRLTLSSSDGYVLSRVDGIATAREIVAMIPLPAEDVQRSLLGLLCTGLVEYLSPEPGGAAESGAAARADILEAAARLARRNHYEVLEVAREATQATIMAAYYRQAKRFHPDGHHTPALSDLRDALEAVFQRVSEAYETLRRPELRQAYDQMLSRSLPAASAPSPDLEARVVEETLQKAEHLLAETSHADAIQALEAVKPLARGRLLAKTRMLLARSYLKSPRGARLAETELTSVLEQDPEYVDAHLMLGQLYRDRGLRGRAAAAFRRALELEPQNRTAFAELESLGEVGGGEGLLSRFRKR
jgi:tetratricopeptide (TPR) repeat protein